MIFNVSVQRVWQNTMHLTQTGQTDFEVISFSCMYLREASTYGVEAVVYSVVRQEGGSTQTVATAKARLARTNRAKLGVGERPHGNLSSHQCEKRSERPTRAYNLNLVGQHRCLSLDCWKWSVWATCR